MSADESPTREYPDPLILGNQNQNHPIGKDFPLTYSVKMMTSALAMGIVQVQVQGQAQGQVQVQVQVQGQGQVQVQISVSIAVSPLDVFAVVYVHRWIMDVIQICSESFVSASIA